MDFPAELQYTKDHEWLRLSDDGSIATVGITDFAQQELGDIVFVDVDTVSEELDQDAVFGTVEAVKTVSELFMPLSGTVLEVNEALESNPELVNDAPYGDGWMIRIELSDSTQVDDLLSADAYAEMVAS